MYSTQALQAPRKVIITFENGNSTLWNERDIQHLFDTCYPHSLDPLVGIDRIWMGSFNE